MARRQRSPRGAYLRGDGLAPDSLGACGQPSDAKDLLRAHVKSLAFLSDPKSLAKFALISAGLAASMGLARMALLGHAWTVCWLASVAVAVWTQHAIAEEVHDGVHQHIFSRVPLNELASKLYASMIGISFRQFRKEHLAHHRFFGSPADPDYPKYAEAPCGFTRWYAYFLRNFTGYAVAERLLRGAGRRQANARASDAKGWAQHPAGTAIAQLSLLGLGSLLVAWPWYFVCWLGPLVTLTYGLTQFRTLLEHWSPNSWRDPKTGESRVGALYNLTGRVQRNFFAAQFGYNYHGLHHHYAVLPNYNLGRLAELSQRAAPAGMPIHTTTYLARVREVLSR